MCAVRADPRLVIFRPASPTVARPIAPARPRFSIHVVPQWRPLRPRHPWLGALGHGMLLCLLSAGLLFGPIGTSSATGEPAGPAPWRALAERPQVALEPFGLWWGLMGSPTVVFADPTLDLAIDDDREPDDFVVDLSTFGGKLTVPWRTQLDGSRFGGSNCGPASLGMILDGFGIGRSTDDLRYRSHLYQGTWGSYTGTGLQHLARVAEDNSVATRGLYDGGRYRTWSIGELRDEVREGHPVMILVKFRLLPGREGSRAGEDHYVVLWDYDDDNFVYNDPAYPSGREGYGRRISPTALQAATRAAIIPGQAVAFLPPKR